MAAKSPRQRAARALCHLNGLPEASTFEGEPMWRSFLPQVDAVLEAALSPDEWSRIKAQDDPKN